MIKFPDLIPGILIKKVNRFTFKVESEGKEYLCHCANTGSMKTCLIPGVRVYIAQAENQERKLKWDLLLSQPDDLCLLTTRHSNALAIEGLEFLDLGGCEVFQEVKRGKSRLDLMLKCSDQKHYIEIKMATHRISKGISAFPDAKTERGIKHLKELCEIARSGEKATLLFLAGRSNCQTVTVSDIDPQYAIELDKAIICGVDVRALALEIGIDGVRVREEIKFCR